MVNGLLLCPTPVHMNLSRFYFFGTAHYLACREARSCMKVCKYGIYLFIRVSVDVLVQGIKWSVQDGIGISRHFSQQKLPGFHRLSPSYLCRVDSHDDIAYHIVDRINKQTNRYNLSISISQISSLFLRQ